MNRIFPHLMALFGLEAALAGIVLTLPDHMPLVMIAIWAVVTVAMVGIVRDILRVLSE